MLYKIEHDNLLDVLNDIIDLAFKGGKRRIIAYDNSKAFWATIIEKSHSQSRN